MMDWRQSYHDLCREIEVLELRANDLEYQMKLARKTVFTGEVPSDRQIIKIPLDKALVRHDDVKEKLLETVAVIEHKRSIKEQMEQHLSQFEGLEYKVAFMRDVQNKPLDVIADELGYSFNWISKISSKIGRIGKNKANTA